MREITNSDAYTHSDLPHYEVNMGKHFFYSMKKKSLKYILGFVLSRTLVLMLF